MKRDEAVKALRQRGRRVLGELARLENIQFEQQPLPDFVETIFDYSLSQLRAEADWIKRTTDYLEVRPE